jgi:hypothetical protein
MIAFNQNLYAGIQHTTDDDGFPWWDEPVDPAPREADTDADDDEKS